VKGVQAALLQTQHLHLRVAVACMVAVVHERADVLGALVPTVQTRVHLTAPQHNALLDEACRVGSSACFKELQRMQGAAQLPVPRTAVLLAVKGGHTAFLQHTVLPSAQAEVHAHDLFKYAFNARDGDFTECLVARFGTDVALQSATAFFEGHTYANRYERGTRDDALTTEFVLQLPARHEELREGLQVPLVTALLSNVGTTSSLELRTVSRMVAQLLPASRVHLLDMYCATVLGDNNTLSGDGTPIKSFMPHVVFLCALSESMGDEMWACEVWLQQWQGVHKAAAYSMDKEMKFQAYAALCRDAAKRGVPFHTHLTSAAYHGAVQPNHRAHPWRILRTGFSFTGTAQMEWVRWFMHCIHCTDASAWRCNCEGTLKCAQVAEKSNPACERFAVLCMEYGLRRTTLDVQYIKDHCGARSTRRQRLFLDNLPKQGWSKHG